MKLRGDLSAPVLAIIVTIGVIAAGLVLLAWFWWFAPQAGKAGSLQILGQPSVVCRGTSGTVYISVKNVGNADINIPVSDSIVVGTQPFDITAVDGQTPSDNVIIGPGKSKTIQASGTCDASWGKAVDGFILTDAGTYATSFTVISL